MLRNFLVAMTCLCTATAQAAQFWVPVAYFEPARCGEQGGLYLDGDQVSYGEDLNCVALDSLMIGDDNVRVVSFNLSCGTDAPSTVELHASMAFKREAGPEWMQLTWDANPPEDYRLCFQ